MVDCLLVCVGSRFSSQYHVHKAWWHTPVMPGLKRWRLGGPGAQGHPWLQRASGEHGFRRHCLIMYVGDLYIPLRSVGCHWSMSAFICLFCILFYFWGRASYRLGWSQTLCVVESHLELPVLLLFLLSVGTAGRHHHTWHKVLILMNSNLYFITSAFGVWQPIAKSEVM